MRRIIISLYFYRMKSMQWFLVLLLLVVGIVSCNTSSSNNSEKKNQLKDSMLVWLGNPQHYEGNEQLYKNRFTETYNNSINKGNFTMAADALMQYGSVLDMLFLPDSFYIKTSIGFLNNHQNKITEFKKLSVTYYIGSQYNFTQQIDSSNYWLRKTIVESKDTSILKNTGLANVVLYDNYARAGKLDTALQIAFSNIKIFEHLKDTINLATVYANISDCFSRQKAYKEADVYTNKNLYYSVLIKDTHNIVQAYINKGFSAKRLQQIDSLTTINSIVQHYMNNWSKKTAHLSCYANYLAGIAKIENKQPDSARYFLNLNNDIIKKFKDLNIKVICALAETDRMQNKPLSNIDEIKESNEYVLQKKHFLYATQLNEFLAYDAAKKNNYALAYAYKQQQYMYRDSVWDDEKRGLILELEKKYETEKKQQQIALQEKSIAAKNNWLAFLITLLVLAFTSFFVYRLWQQKKAIKKQNLFQQQFNMQLMQKTEEERKRIAADLHDSVNHELMSLKKLFDTNSTGLNNKIDTIIEDVRNISRNLSPVLFDNVGLQLSIEQMVERIQHQNNFILTADINYNNSLSSAKELQLYRILQEAITNMVKYSQAIAGKVTITEDEKLVKIEVKDNGKGFDVAQTLGSKNAFGLHNIIERSKAIGGVANIISNTNGTIITISISKK